MLILAGFKLSDYVSVNKRRQRKTNVVFMKGSGLCSSEMMTIFIPQIVCEVELRYTSNSVENAGLL